jgi:(p)ppGpp synthase/HD superfamily hydrolase
MNRYSVHGDREIARADLFAFAAHSAVKQVRKYTGAPYIEHPREVAALVQALPSHTWQMVVIALLHDVVEDTGVTRQQIIQEFGDEIGEGLFYLTNVDPKVGNRAERHIMNVTRLRAAPRDVATVKCLDIKSNIRNIVDLDPKFAPQYLREKAEAMENLRQADPIVWRLTVEQIARLKKQCLDLGLCA